MPARITNETVQALINLIYEAAVDPSQWPVFLRAFARAVEARGTLIYTHNFETMDASLAAGESFPNAVIDFDEHFLSVLEYYNHVNVWAQNETMLEAGRPVTGAMLYPESKLPKTEQVKTFLTEHPNVQLHFTPTYSSWLNQVKLWLGRIERDVIARACSPRSPI